METQCPIDICFNPLSTLLQRIRNLISQIAAKIKVKSVHYSSKQGSIKKMPKCGLSHLV